MHTQDNRNYTGIHVRAFRHTFIISAKLCHIGVYINCGLLTRKQIYATVATMYIVYWFFKYVPLKLINFSKFMYMYHEVITCFVAN